MAVLFLIAAFSPGILSAQGSSGKGNDPLPASGSYARPVTLIARSLSPSDSVEYRFDPLSPWLMLEGSLELDAFAGEERRYDLEIRYEGMTRSVSYTIDRKAPSAPGIGPVSGDAGSSVTVRISGENALMASVDGSPFESWNPAEPRTLYADPDAARVATVIAYAVDQAGNAGAVSRASWRLLPEGIRPSSAFSPIVVESGKQFSAAADGTLSATAEFDAVRGLSVTITVPPGSLPALAVNAPDAVDSALPWAILGHSSGPVNVIVPVPRGYTREFVIDYGYRDTDGLHVAATPLRIKPSFEQTGQKARVLEAPPPMVTDSEGGTVLAWPVTAGIIFVSLSGSTFERYTAPIILAPGTGTATVSWYVEASDRSRSLTASMAIDVKALPLPPMISGASTSAVYGTEVILLADRTVRYEFSDTGAEVTPISDASPKVGEGIRVAGRAGAVVRYRYRFAMLDKAGRPGLERFLSFDIDREPPPPPMLASDTTRYSEGDATVAFEHTADTIFVSISLDGSASFVPYSGPVSLNAVEDGRNRYIVRAYAEDRFGNRSAEMKPLDIIIDKDSVYVAADGRIGARGSPDDPLASISDAIEKARASGKSVINLRGGLVSDTPLVISSDLSIVGGFDRNWNRIPSLRGSIRFTTAPTGLSMRPDMGASASVTVSGAELWITGLDMLSEISGIADVIRVEQGSLALEDASIATSGGLDSRILRAISSSVSMTRVEMRAASAVTARAIDAVDSDVRLDGVGFVCEPSVRLFEAVRIKGGRMSASSLRMDAKPSHAFAGFALEGTETGIAGLALFAGGGSSSFRLASLDASSLTLTSAYVEASWRGEIEVIKASNGSILRLAHATILLAAPGVTVIDA
ncbi:MAG: hypothetical protein E4H20_09635, partial [Spirochaetales bacterium]